MERQRQRRLARLSQQSDGKSHGSSPQNSQNSVISSTYTDSEQQSLLTARQNALRSGTSKKLPPLGLGSVDYLDGGGHSQLTHRPQSHHSNNDFSDNFSQEEGSQRNRDLISV